ncbi:PREDICTED: uncharacterized protein LOC105451336 [Wasmannia auropunctata]|uniref:uncharacterized protein LOC105451336 n=1 Tax=Wasmannia auropunctata TaxID=64793 RepID=UPI0005F03BD7|nr:PREDICTED: uncharacterized protein LOC105451336 [Wasmannia auropunctata]
MKALSIYNKDFKPYTPHNFCRGSLEEIKQRTRDLYQYWILPNFKEVTPEWEHMTRCIVESVNYFSLMNIPYKTMALLAMDALNINMPHIYASMNYVEWITYKSGRFILRYVLRFSSFRIIFNTLIGKVLNVAMNLSPEKEAELQKKSEKLLSSFSIMH